jgi:hypothetical protein
VQIPKPNTGKRKLVGAAAEAGDEDKDSAAVGKEGKGGKVKKKKVAKGLLSFDEAEGES